MFIFLNYLIPGEFKNMIESLSLGDFKGLSTDIEIYENSQGFKNDNIIINRLSIEI